jgi:hypothetical protein
MSTDSTFYELVSKTELAMTQTHALKTAGLSMRA